MELPSVSLIELLKPVLEGTAPWIGLSILTGLVSASAFFLFIGRGFRSLPTYLLLGALMAPVGQLLGENLHLPAGPLTVGEVDLVVLTLATWGLLGIARLLRL